MSRMSLLVKTELINLRLTCKGVDSTRCAGLVTLQLATLRSTSFIINIYPALWSMPMHVPIVRATLQWLHSDWPANGWQQCSYAIWSIRKIHQLAVVLYGRDGYNAAGASLAALGTPDYIAIFESKRKVPISQITQQVGSVHTAT